MRNENKSEYTGNIVMVREVEDCIRATKKYTEGIGTMLKKHPIQGEDFPSKTFCKYYEVYPDVEVGWDMPVGVALDLLWQDTPCIDVMFKYDYRQNRASIIIRNGVVAIKELSRGIPRFRDSLKKVVDGNRKTTKI